MLYDGLCVIFFWVRIMLPVCACALAVVTSIVTTVLFLVVKLITKVFWVWVMFVVYRF